MSWVRETLREHRPLLAVLAGAVAVGFVVQAVAGLDGVMRQLAYRPSYEHFARLIVLPLPFAFLALRLGARGADGQWLAGRAGWRESWRRFRAVYLRPARIAGALVAGACTAAILNLFGAWKVTIPKLQPFAWDVRLSDVDRALHGGRLPWEWLHPLLARPAVTDLFDYAYFIWPAFLPIVCAWQAWSRRRELRMRFFVAFALTWFLLGDVAATLLSSAGPCYFGRVATGPDPYAPLMAYLAQAGESVQLTTPFVQNALWERYTGASATPYTGISAMPSLHVAMCVLYALVGWHTARWLGALLGAYALVILVGSVHLGWHYAIDGYLSVVAVGAIWLMAGRLARGNRPHDPR